MKKRFSIERAMTVYTGVCMGRGIGIAQDLFDHLYPGIMTIGCAHMQPKAAAEIERQHPVLADVEPISSDPAMAGDYLRFLADARERLGDAIEVEGPVSGESTGLRLELELLAEKGFA